MNSPLLPPTSPRPPSPLLTTERVRELLTAADPDYGRDFTEAQWNQIAERLSALARLIWQDHPGYAPDPTMTKAEIQSRITAIGSIHRTDDLTQPRGHRMRQERIAEL